MNAVIAKVKIEMNSILQGDHHIISEGMLKDGLKELKAGMLLSPVTNGYEVTPVSHSSKKPVAVLLEDVTDTTIGTVVTIALHGAIRLEHLMFDDKTSINATTIEELRAVGIYAIGTMPPSATAPVIATNLEDLTTTTGVAIDLVILATSPDGGSLSYQWSENTSKTTNGGTAIDGATSASYSPNVSTAGTKYYYVEITNTLGNTTKMVKSAAASVITSAN